MSSVEDFILLSKLAVEPFAKTIGANHWLFYKGEAWDIDMLLQDFYTFDSDVYEQLHLDPLLHELFVGLSAQKRFTVFYDEVNSAWVCKSESTSLQEEFLNWLSLDLKFEISQ